MTFTDSERKLMLQLLAVELDDVKATLAMLRGPGEEGPHANRADMEAQASTIRELVYKLKLEDVCLSRRT